MVWGGQRMVSITKVNAIHLTITGDRLYGWVYGVDLNSDITFNERGVPQYDKMEELKSDWYIKRFIYKTIMHYKTYPDLMNGTVFAVTDETVRVKKGKVMCVSYKYFHKLALIRYLDETYGKDDNVLGVFVEITDNRIVTTRVVYRDREQEITIEDYNEYRTKTIPYKISSRK